MITSVVKYFSGSTPRDFEQPSDQHPFSPCPDSPNCTVHSVEYYVDLAELVEAVKSAFEQLSPYEWHFNSESLHFQAIFRIPVFGFKDDVNVEIESKGTQKNVLYIKSASRVGHSDLGVNRRRVKRILSAINQHLKFNL